MPLLFSLGQHAAFQAMNDNEFLFAFLDDVCIDRVGEVYKSLGAWG